VGFLDVDDEDGGAVLEVGVDFVEGGNLPPEWRSGVGAEDEEDGAVAAKLGEANALFGSLDGEVEVGGEVADFDGTGAGLVPHGREGGGVHERPGKLHHESRKFGWGFLHRRKHESEENAVDDDEDNETPEQPPLHMSSG
jgi:hypothetical protein